jgi:hypothetical protein
MLRSQLSHTARRPLDAPREDCGRGSESGRVGLVGVWSVGTYPLISRALETLLDTGPSSRSRSHLGSSGRLNGRPVGCWTLLATRAVEGSGGHAADANDGNAGIIEEFRSHGGAVGGQFEGAPLLLLTTVGRRSGSAAPTR